MDDGLGAVRGCALGILLGTLAWACFFAVLFLAGVL